MFNWLRRLSGKDTEDEREERKERLTSNPEVIRAKAFLDEMQQRIDVIRAERQVITHDRDSQ